MVTSAFKTVIEKYIDSIGNIMAWDKEGYDASRASLAQSLVKDLDVLQAEYPLLAAYNRQKFEDNPSPVLETIKESAHGATKLQYVAVGSYWPFSLEDSIICQPDVIDFQEKGNIAIRPLKDRPEVAAEVLQEMILNMFLSVEIGRLHMTIINIGLSEELLPIVQNLNGSRFQMIFEQRELEQFANQLNERVKQKILTGKVDSPDVEVVVVLDYQEHCDVVDRLFSTAMKKGKTAGIHFVFHNDNHHEESSDFVTIHDTTLARFYWDETDLCHCKRILDCPNFLQACYDYINADVKAEGEDLASLSSYRNTSSAIYAPIGYKENHEAVEFKMDVNKGHYHAFIIGETGSGKSRFLHDILINMVNYYSPEDVELYLMDFKGVEFNDYRDIKHSRVVLVDRADERITYEVIYELKEKMEERQRILRNANASDVDEFNRNHSDHHLSQIILVADECQTLFSDRTHNSCLQNEMIDIIALIAQQGRAYGVHLLLATQSLSNAPQLGKEILNQIGEHYILPCLPADARRLVPDHEGQATEKVVSQMEKGKGQCYYQGADGKFLFTFTYIKKGEDQSRLLANAKEKSKDYESNGQIYFSGSLQFSYTKDVIRLVSKKGRQNLLTCPGQAINLSQAPLPIILREDMSENILLMGINDKYNVTQVAMNMMVSAIAVSKAKDHSCETLVLDCYDDDEAEYFETLETLADLGLCKIIRKRDRQRVLYDLCKEIAKGPSSSMKMLYILGEENFRELKFNLPIDASITEQQNAVACSMDTFSDVLAAMNAMSNPVTNAGSATDDISSIKTICDAIEYILDKGPECGVHVVAQLDKIDNLYINNEGYINYKSVYAKFKHLVLLRSSEKDLPNLRLPDDVRPDKLENNSERQRAYYYNESNNHYELFTPFVPVLPNQIDKLINEA